MKSFYEWFESQKRILYAEDDEWVAKKGWEARQAEVYKLQSELDELQKKLAYQENAYKNVKLQFINKDDDFDELQTMYEKQGLYAFELQKRINDLENWCVSGVECNMLSTEYNQALIDMIKILKGENND